MAKRGGGIFTYVVDPITGATKLTTLSIVLIILLCIGILLAIVLPFVLKKSDNNKKYGGAVAPPISQQPGRINITEVAQSPSSEQAIVYFNKAEAFGTTCDSCTAEFDVYVGYIGGSSQQLPFQKKLTSPVLNGTITFDYSVPLGATRPTSIDIAIFAHSVNPQTGARGEITRFYKTLPYVA